ncbi:glycoside hydrolase family 43 protein [Microbacterium aoyamense]|uniref:Glycoside hydrolase family 43 protein n=1 Tax=Microbacterium aoyamense TaxID=344166 RepID=A0ABP5B4F0_9MICO|nr:glycoside hydrolase family 43 protein [Microbacterium aoyamense]
MGRYRNPILAGCHPDPSICRVGDAYYLVTSTFAYLPGLPIHRSRNLVDWEPVGHAIHRPEQLDLSGLASSRGLYAPTIRFHNGVFYVVCTVVGAEEGGDTSDRRLGHFVVTATDATGPWSDPVWIDALGGFDPSLTFDGERVWLCATAPAVPLEWPGQTDVWIRELDPISFAGVGEPVRIWGGAMAGAVWAEGPHVMARPGGGWMLVAAEGGTSRDHAVCVAYAETITGPYAGDPGNPRLTHRDLGDRAEIVDVGHADLVEAPDGRWWAVLLAVSTARGGANGILGRQTHLVPVDWVDGRPFFAPGSARVSAVMAADGIPDQAPPETLIIDDFDGAELDAAWNAVGRFPQQFVDLHARPGWARVSASGVEPSEVGSLAFLGRRLAWPRCLVRASIERSGAGRAGLLARMSEDAYLEISGTDAGVAEVALASEGSRAIIAQRPGAAAAGTVEIAFDGLDAVVALNGEHLARVDVSALAPTGDGTFVGVWVGVFAVGDGTVDVDRFELREGVGEASVMR